MVTEVVPYLDLPAERPEDSYDPPVFWGNYMPFAGVRYFAILSPEDIARGKARIPAVGWRPRKTGNQEEMKTPAQLPVAV